VRQAESLARSFLRKKKQKRVELQEDPNIIKLCHDLSLALGAQVKIIPKKKGGRLEIHYHTMEDLDGIISRLRGEK
jgi:ParB family chromosome partitioning protein